MAYYNLPADKNLYDYISLVVFGFLGLVITMVQVWLGFQNKKHLEYEVYKNLADKLSEIHFRTKEAVWSPETKIELAKLPDYIDSFAFVVHKKGGIFLREKIDKALHMPRSDEGYEGRWLEISAYAKVYLYFKWGFYSKKELKNL